jgi:hypothetical protein
MVQSIQEALEAAANQVEQIPTYLTFEAIAELISTDGNPSSYEYQKATDLLDGLNPLFAALAQKIRETPIQVEPETERDRMVFDLALQMAKSRLYDEVRNPVVKPRKNFNQPLKKQGIWWTRIEEILKGLEQNPQDLFAHERSIWIQGWNLACQQAATLLRTTKAFVVDDDGHTRARRPEEYAQLIEDLEP